MLGRASFLFLFCVSGVCRVVSVSLFLDVSTSAIDCLERLVSEMTCYVSSGTLNPTHSLTHLCKWIVSVVMCLMVNCVCGTRRRRVSLADWYTSSVQCNYKKKSMKCRGGKLKPHRCRRARSAQHVGRLRVENVLNI